MCQPSSIRADAITDYWRTSQGLKERWKLFSNNAVYSMYNTIMREIADAWGADLEYRCHPEDTATGPCPECTPFCGHVYHRGMFKPILPRHPKCVCEWVPFYREGRKFVGVV